MAAMVFAFGFVLVFMVVVALAAFLYRKLFGHQIWVKFLNRTGYRRRADPYAPVEAQARAVLDEIFRAEGIVRGPWVRDVDEQTLTYNAWMYEENGATVTQESWMLEMPVEVPWQVQIVERRLAQPGLRQTLASAALGRERRWGQLLPVELPTGDPIFDERFLVLVDKEASLPRFLQDPGVRRYVTALPEACLVVAQKWVTLDDPAGALRRHHVGLSAVTPAQLLDREPAAHDQVAQTLAILSRAVRAV